jgi:hypothetical protein
MFPLGELKRVSDLLGNNYIITNPPPFNESLLRRMDIVRQMRFESVCNALRDNFVYDIAKANWSEAPVS